MASDDHLALALQTGSRLYAWGLNDEGQLGIGRLGDTYAPVRLRISLDGP